MRGMVANPVKPIFLATLRLCTWQPDGSLRLGSATLFPTISDRPETRGDWSVGSAGFTIDSGLLAALQNSGANADGTFTESVNAGGATLQLVPNTMTGACESAGAPPPPPPG